MLTRAIAVAAVASCASAALAQEITITFENLNPTGGFTFSPLWFGVHDGSFNAFDAGDAASLHPGIAEVAELADAGPLGTRFSSAAPTGVAGLLASADAVPPFQPGESASATVNVGDPAANRFFSYASMVVPSNDMFIGNDAALELFDASGVFNGPVTINLFGMNVWDAGSEINNITDGGAFIMGVDATGGVDENGVIRPFFSDAGAAAYLNSIVGLTSAPGDTITTAFGSADLIGRITIVPAPGAAAAAGLLCFAGLRRRR